MEDQVSIVIEFCNRLNLRSEYCAWEMSTHNGSYVTHAEMHENVYCVGKELSH